MGLIGVMVSSLVENAVLDVENVVVGCMSDVVIIVAVHVVGVAALSYRLVSFLQFLELLYFFSSMVSVVLLFFVSISAFISSSLLYLRTSLGSSISAM